MAAIRPPCRWASSSTTSRMLRAIDNSCIGFQPERRSGLIAWSGRLRQPYFVKELAGEKSSPYRPELCTLPGNLYERSEVPWEPDSFESLRRVGATTKSL